MSTGLITTREKVIEGLDTGGNKEDPDRIVIIRADLNKPVCLEIIGEREYHLIVEVDREDLQVTTIITATAMRVDPVKGLRTACHEDRPLRKVDIIINPRRNGRVKKLEGVLEVPIMMGMSVMLVLNRNGERGSIKICQVCCNLDWAFMYRDKIVLGDKGQA